MRLSSWLALGWREARGSAGRLLFFTTCLAVGVAAVVAVAALSAAVERGIQAQARELLAADFEVTSRRPIAAPAAAAVEALGGRWTEVLELPSMVSVARAPGGPTAAGTSLLAELKAVGAGYPFYGRLVTDPEGAAGELLGPEQVLVGPELLTRLDLAVGDSLRVGEATFVIAGTVIAEPDRLQVSFALGPRVLLSLDGLARSGLAGVGSRVSYRLLAALAEGATDEEVARAARQVQASVPDPAVVTVETYAEAQPNLRRGLGRVAQFLGLVALLSLLVGGIGVAQAVRAWLASRLDEIAVLRALGMRPGEALTLYLAQTVALALVGSAVGALLGSALAAAAPTFVAGFLPAVRLEVGWQPAAVLRGLGLGLGVAVLFALRPLLGVMRVPPVRVLRRDAEPLPERRGVAALLSTGLIAGIATIAAMQAGSVLRGLQFAAGLVVAAVVLAGGARWAMWWVGRSSRKSRTLAVRHGLAALARPGAGTLGAVVALGLGVMTVLGMYLLQDRLTAQLDADLPADAPTVFLVDIQTEQWPGVRRALEEAGAERLDAVEVVMARLREVAGVPVSELVASAGRDRNGSRDRRWVLTREQRLTSLATLPGDNVVVEGALWSDPDRAEVSVELDFASDLGVGVGDSLLLDVQGVPLELVVTSLRTVDWGSFSINFFLVVEPGVLDGAPGFRIAAARLPPSAEGPLQDRLAATYPNVTVLRLREVLEKVVAVLEYLGLGVRLLGGFTVLAGIAILGGAVAAGSVRRGREAALLKTLGMTRAQIAMVFSVEYGLVGMVAGVIGTAGGVVLAWAVTRFGLEAPWAWSPGAMVAAVVGTVLLSVGAGLLSSLRALAVSPMVVIRGR